MGWEPELDELRRRQELARRMGGEERVARQHPSGRLDGTGGGGSFAQSRRFLSYLPPSVWQAPPVVLGDDRADRREEELAEIFPRDRRTPYDGRGLLALVCDRDSVFELGARYGRPVITALARLDGRWPRSRPASTPSAPRSEPPSASASRRSSTHATPARCRATGRPGRTRSPPNKSGARRAARGHSATSTDRGSPERGGGGR